MMSLCTPCINFDFMITIYDNNFANAANNKETDTSFVYVDLKHFLIHLSSS